MLAWPILAPLAAAALILLVRRAAAGFALAGTAGGVGSAVWTLIQVAAGARPGATFGGLPDRPLRLAVDPLAAVLSVTVGTVALLVFVYAVGYMRKEESRTRFYVELSLFVAAMQLLVLAGDWVLLLVAWELIGLASYLLIGFWYERPGVAAAATRAFLTTRGADLGLYLGVFVLVARAGTSDILATLGVGVGDAAAAGASLLLLLAAMGKAAQVPFQGWLQDAMVGPTPVSALLHSATLVAAGAILLVRVFPLFPPSVLPVVGAVGGLSVVLGGLMALAQRDFKRMLAASTSSQLGFLVLAVGAGAPVAAVVHLVVHAAMKAALFLGAGVFQHAYSDTGFDRLRGVGRAYPVVFGAVVVAGLSLAAVPPLAGFWSKELVEAAALSSPNATVLGSLALAGAVLGGAYVARALRLLWVGDASRRPVAGLTWMLVALVALSLLAATLGVIVQPLAVLVGVAPPDTPAGRALGVAAAALGLTLGAVLPAERLLGPVFTPALQGFRVADGWIDVAVRPALVIAQWANGVERVLDTGVLRLGSTGIGIARGPAASLDAALSTAVLGVGRTGMLLARSLRGFDDVVLEGGIVVLVRSLRAFGERGRRLQTGLVYRELAIAASGTMAAVVILFLAR